jgi:beta-1,4-mannosyl-glycoprotein beta-1,4-N-acetylglucosaminyltransferase
MRTFDCFLFFNELDLLEIRLNLLYSHVDYFVIVESEITFQGKLKEFVFEKNQSRFEKFKDKILYYKIYQYNIDFTKLPYITNAQSDDEIVLNKIYKLVDEANDFDKKEFWWGNDNFQRESIWRALAQAKPSDSDLILLSDADEIINPDALAEIKKNITFDTIYSCKQHEFYYFLNYYHNSDWFGHVCFFFGSYKYQSLNRIRTWRTTPNLNFKVIVIENAGWHFTNLGTVKNISEKIKSWGHREFNTKIVLNSLNYNIQHGYDIFRRNNFGKLKSLNPDDVLLAPIFDSNSYISSDLVGPRILKENTMKSILFLFYFKVSTRICQYFQK